MRSLLLILNTRTLDAVRWLRAHGFQFLALWPVVAGGLLWALGRILPWLAGPLAGALAGPLGEIALWPSLLASLLLAGLTLPSTLAELFPRRGPALFVLALPVPRAVRFLATLLVCWAKALPLATALLLFCRLLAPEAPGWATLGVWGASLLAALALLGLWQVLGLQLLVHWRLLRPLPMLCLAVALGLACFLPMGEGRWHLAPWALPATLLDGVLRAALGLQVPAREHLAPAWAGGVLLLAAAAWLLDRLWHRRDLEKAARVARARLGVIRRPAGAVAAQTRRDLLLVVRRFSPAVVLLAATSLGLLAATALAADAATRAPYWRGRLALTGCLAAVLSAVSLAPLLLRHQLPRFWIERSSGLERPEIWRSKVWLARCLALPVVAAGGVLLLALPLGSLPARGLLVLELAVAGWMAASILGASTFETADQPILGLAFGALLAAAMAGFMIFYRSYWPLGVVAFLWVSSLLADRASERVRIMEVDW